MLEHLCPTVFGLSRYQSGFPSCVCLYGSLNILKAHISQILSPHRRYPLPVLFAVLSLSAVLLPSTVLLHSTVLSLSAVLLLSVILLLFVILSRFLVALFLSGRLSLSCPRSSKFSRVHPLAEGSSIQPIPFCSRFPHTYGRSKAAGW